MLAAGCIPVVNDAEHNRVVLDNDHVATPRDAVRPRRRALATLVDRPPSGAPARRAAAASVERDDVGGRGPHRSGRIVRVVVAAAAAPPGALAA